MIAPGFPCNLCGVRAGIPCRHRPDEVERAPTPLLPEDRRLAPKTGQGYNFRNRKMKPAVQARAR